MTTVVLLVLSAVCALWLPGRLARAAWPVRSPRLGIAAVLAVAYTGLASFVLAGVTLAVHWRETHHLIDTAWQVCVDALHGAHGPADLVAAVGGLVLVAAVGCRLAVGFWPVTVVGRRRRRAHAEQLDLVGTPFTTPGVTVVPHAAASAYVLPSREPRVVITTGALAALDGAQTDAVLAHERAHLHGRHHRLFAAAQVLTAAFSFVRPLHVLERQVAGLVEMRADDVAVRGRSRLALARALVAMAGAGATPAGTLHAAEVDVVRRLERLLRPPRRLPAAARAVVVLGIVALTALPVLLVLHPPVFA